MKIGIDCRMIDPENGGLGRYVEQLVLHLACIANDNQYTLFLNKKNFNDNNLNTLDTRFKKAAADIPWYGWEEQVKFKPIIEKENVDIMHFPHWNIPLMYSSPYVVTIHDLIMHHYPRPDATTKGKLTYAVKDKLHRIVVRRAVQAARHIIATSEFTKNDIHKTLGVSKDKISVVYQAPFIGNYELKIKNYELVKKKYGINRSYVIYVGSAYPHKNLRGLIKAWKILGDKYGRGWQLVLAGKQSKFYERLLEEEQIGAWNDVIFTGFVEDSDLAELYRNAKLYVFPSFYEGFGLPPLEAMSHGVPVVSSNRSCMPEILGEGAIYFDPDNHEQIAEIMHIALTDENLRHELRQKAKEELKRYSWDKLARETLDIYESRRL